MLQQGESVNPVLVYLPMADVYAGHGVGGLHLDVEVQNRLDPTLLDAIRREGYDFDVVNDHALAELMKVEGRELRAGTGRYQVVVVNNARYMPPESAARIAELVRAGGHLVVVGKLPEEAPGVKDRESRTAAMRGAFAALWNGQAPSAPAVSSSFSAALVPDVAAGVTRLAQVLPPDFRILPGRPQGQPAGAAQGVGPAREHVGFTHRRIGQADCYFVSNVSADPRDLHIEFAAGHRRPQRWNPETGRSIEPPYEFAARNRTAVEVRLAPFESCFIVFGANTAPPALAATDPRGTWELTREGSDLAVRGLVPSAGEYEIRAAGGRSRRVRAGALPAPIDVAGPWQLTLSTRAPLRLERLRPWGELEAGHGFSGWGVYEVSVQVPDLGDDTEWFVDLGEVHETAEVVLNGSDLGAAWKGPRRLPCGDALKRGANNLRIEVANLWIHHVLAHPPGDPARLLKGVGADRAVAETAGIRWGAYGEVPPEKVAPSGLLGPVRLVPMKRLRVEV
jgi:hypothetical protein